VRAAAAIARAARADLRARTVIEPIARSRSAVVEPYRADGLIGSATANARRALDAVLALLPSASAATGEVVVGSPAEALCALSREVDLLVCGSRAYGPARHVLLGSVTHGVIRNASCPVVLVPRGTHNALARALARAEQAASR
jgi:nucleotide-binding universal stress UspA family protein